jgi:large subunit ribosomal protein L20
MPKASRSVAKRKRHRKWIDRAKGYRGRRKKTFKLAKEAVLKAGQHAYAHRRDKKAQFRSLWQSRINAAVRQHGLSYSKFISQAKQQDIIIDRKILAELAVKHPQSFEAVVKKSSK